MNKKSWYVQRHIQRSLLINNKKKNQSAEGAGGLGIIRSNKVGETE